MFENNQSLPKEFGTPLRKKQKLTKLDYEYETDYSQGRSSLTKSSGVPSTIESPRLHSTIEEPYFDIELCSVRLEEEESEGRCQNYY